MARPVTLFTGQWADLTLEVIAEKASQWGYDGIELPCWGDHFNVQKALSEPNYCKGRHELLGKYGLKCWAISNHLTGQLVLDHNDARTDDWVPAAVRGDAKKKTEWAIQEMKDYGAGRPAAGRQGGQRLHRLVDLAPALLVPAGVGCHDRRGIQAVRRSLEPDPRRLQGMRRQVRARGPSRPRSPSTSTPPSGHSKAINHRPEFGFNFDPSHLLWQMVDPVEFIRAFPDRIYHVHVKDAARTLDGRSGILASHLNFGDPRRGWDFRSPGRGQVNFEEIARALNHVGYEGPLSVEWEDCGMDREYGAAEAARFVKEKMGFKSAGRLFDSAFAEAQAKS